MRDSITCRWVKVPGRLLRSADPDAPAVTDRQERVPGFNQARLSELCVLQVGAGGINGEIGHGLVRKGVGCLKVFDPDRVELTNLNRQRFFEKDLGEYKAFALVRNLAAEAVRETWLAGCAMAFEEAIQAGEDTVCHIGVCGVDNNRARIFTSQYFGRSGTPLVLIGVANDASHGYVFVQEPRAACFGCVFPDAVENLKDPCPNTPAVIDILKVVAGVALYAVDSLVMGRKRAWNYKHIFLDGSVPERCLTVARRPGCSLCQRMAEGR